MLRNTFFDLGYGLPREDTIRSLEELSRVQNIRRGRIASMGIREDDHFEGEIIAYSIFNKKTGEMETLSPEEFQQRYGCLELLNRNKLLSS